MQNSIDSNSKQIHWSVLFRVAVLGQGVLERNTAIDDNTLCHFGRTPGPTSETIYYPEPQLTSNK